MPKFLVPVDGSEASLKAIDHIAASRGAYREPVEIHLVNVQPPLPSDVSAHIAQDQLRGYHHDQGIEALAGARARLERSGVDYVFHIGVGEPGHVITHFARELNCDEIVMATRGQGGIAGALGSVAMRVVHLASCPILLIK
jgi:nucleotide-binding universal stress UspA family protein